MAEGCSYPGRSSSDPCQSTNVSSYPKQFISFRPISAHEQIVEPITTQQQSTSALAVWLSVPCCPRSVMLKTEIQSNRAGIGCWAVRRNTSAAPVRGFVALHVIPPHSRRLQANPSEPPRPGQDSGEMSCSAPAPRALARNDRVERMHTHSCRRQLLPDGKATQLSCMRRRGRRARRPGWRRRNEAGRVSRNCP